MMSFTIVSGELEQKKKPYLFRVDQDQYFLKLKKTTTHSASLGGGCTPRVFVYKYFDKNSTKQRKTSCFIIKGNITTGSSAFD